MTNAQGSTNSQNLTNVPKYFNPADHSQTWDGVGASPEWMEPYRVGECKNEYRRDVTIEYRDSPTTEDILDWMLEQGITFNQAKERWQEQFKPLEHDFGVIFL